MKTTPSTNNFSSRMERFRQLFREADAVLVGAGSGLSAAAGLDYSGADFQREFAPWIARYGFTDLYTSSFYPFESEEERWAYWARHIWFARFRPEALPLYRQLHALLNEKPHFVITTNVDGQFEKAGFSPAKMFATQGDYAYLQAASGMPKKRYECREWVFRALEATHDCRIPTALVPRCPDTGEPMAPHLRCDDTFVEDEQWHRQARRYEQFLKDNLGDGPLSTTKKVLLVELGVGFNTPGIIRYPFEQIAATCSNAWLVRLNRDHPEPLWAAGERFLWFNEDMAEVLSHL